ncbi:DNA ligase 1 [Halyomorpha halys]|uniref:DNA ligase 1 n=1 Tax=Halyomorpha halys TaxID=286706 RepID=UPI0006D516D6|nr:uncharacterized protein LOC106683388 [Halyomorpha halys]
MSLPVLNLLNFEIPSANKCKYVLTSPRSLKACRKAGIKPVELLYKSASEFERKSGKKEDAQILFQAYEKERQRKLALCRAIRNQYLLHGYSLVKDTLNKPERIRRYSPRLQEVKDRALPVIRECYLRKRADTPENMRNIKDHFEEKIDRNHLNLPKVNVTFEQTLGTKDKLDEENKKTEKMFAAESKEQNTPARKPAESDNNDEEAEIEKPNTPDEVQQVLFKDPVETNYSSLACKPECQQRPDSAHKRKSKESKRKSKIAEERKLFQKLSIQYSDPDYCIQKYKQVIENSVERDLKELEVHKVQRELEVGMEKWQDRILLLQWLDVNRAKEQAGRELEIKVERLQQKNRAKTIIHTMNINKVKEAEDMKAEGLRRQVEEKDRKINNLHQEKERIIGQSKSRALFIQELKDHIRSIMTPETFDQKVNKLGMHKRVLDSHMCARVMQRSHIWLG